MVVGVSFAYRPLLGWWVHHNALALPCECAFIEILVIEPSSIAYHPLRRTLLVASDQGSLAELNDRFELIGRYEVLGDLEGIEVHPRRGSVYLTSEEDNAILEYDLEQRRVLRTLIVDFPSCHELETKVADNRGLEGVCFVPDGDGMTRMYAVVEARPPRLIELAGGREAAAPEAIAGRFGAKQIGTIELLSVKQVIDIGVDGLSDVIYVPQLDRLVIVSSENRIGIICRTDGTIERRFRLPGKKPEGLAFLPGGDLLVVEDTGGLWRLTSGLKAVARLADARITAFEK